MALHTLNTCSWVENPLLRMQLDIPVLFKYKTETHEIKDLPKLNNFKALNRKEQLSESKEFLKSNATITPGICLILVYTMILC